MIETIGEAWQLGWRVTARCNAGRRDGMKSIRPCIYSYELDLRTLIWTCGSIFPLRRRPEMPELRIAEGVFLVVAARGGW